MRLFPYIISTPEVLHHLHIFGVVVVVYTHTHTHTHTCSQAHTIAQFPSDKRAHKVMFVQTRICVHARIFLLTGMSMHIPENTLISAHIGMFLHSY